MINKRGDLPSIMFTIVVIAVIGIMLLLFNTVFSQVYAGFDNYFNESEEYNQSQAHTSLQEIIVFENTIWDYVFLGITFAYVLSLFLLSYSVRISPAFYFIYGVMILFGLVLGVMFSNLWQEMVTNPQLADVVVRFPITDAILGGFYPLFVAVVAITSMVLLFGKRNTGGEL